MRNSVIDSSVQKVSSLVYLVFLNISILYRLFCRVLLLLRSLWCHFSWFKECIWLYFSLVFDMLRAVKVPSKIQKYVQSFYSQLFVTVTNWTWETPSIPFCWGVFQGNTLSPIIFLITFNLLLKLAADLNQGHGYTIELPLQGSENLPPLNGSVYVKWMKEGDEPLGWYRMRVAEYFSDCSCRVVYDDSLEATVTEIINFALVEWLPCSQTAKKFVPLDSTPSTIKSKWKPSLKYYHSSEHSIKAYADDATLISDCLEMHTKVLQTIDQRAKDLDLFFNQPSVCHIYLTVAITGSRELSYLGVIQGQ